MDESVTTQVKKWVWLMTGTGMVIIWLISYAAVTVCCVCTLNSLPLATGLWAAQEVTARVGDESSCERGWWSMIVQLHVHEVSGIALARYVYRNPGTHAWVMKCPWNIISSS